MQNLFSTPAKLLIFRSSRDRLIQLHWGHLLFGIACTWVVGVGRYWDDPGAKTLQHLGLGSVVYVFLLSLMLWLVIWPLRPPKQWSYFNVLTFVALTSPPALLYAIPVERFFTLDAARSLNIWFLGAVATWRVALLVFFLRRYGQLDALQITVGAFLPLTIIVTTLTALNLERAVFNIMGGLREGTANDRAYAVLIALTIFSFTFLLPLSLCYIGLVIGARKRRRLEREASVSELPVV
jgi:hypothetical protein